MQQKRKKSCPVCKRVATDLFAPFCSKRCADADLGNWINEKYAVAVTDDAVEDSIKMDPDSDTDKPLH
jgi:endogenous inhibitor of DNA gyrase (YacG/DUF329 family)